MIMQAQLNSIPLLEVKSLTKSFGGLMAVDDVSIQFKEKELCSIVGPNGAGKTTFFNLITGQCPPSSGKIYFKGKPITNLAPDEIFRMGIVRTFQEPSVFPKLTVLKNIEIAAQGKFRTSNVPWGRLTVKPRQIQEKALNLLGELNIYDLRYRFADSLTYADKRRLEISMALICEPDLLLLDEPTAGMALEETEQTVLLLKKISSKNTIVLIEHDMNVVIEIADRVTVLDSGRVLADGPPERILANKEVRKVYMGETE
jgi:branched-chain amino acid transport system ATP-binding protein